MSTDAGAELVVFRDQRGDEFVSYRLGYPLAEPYGRNVSNFYINNHLRITIRYHDVNTKVVCVCVCVCVCLLKSACCAGDTHGEDRGAGSLDSRIRAQGLVD